MGDFFEDPDIGWEGINYLIGTLFFIGPYYLWVLVLSVVPIFFSLPMGMRNVDFYNEQFYSLTWVVGAYDPTWWIAGVLVSGFWAYCLVLLVPVLGGLYFLIWALCCC